MVYESKRESDKLKVATVGSLGVDRERRGQWLAGVGRRREDIIPERRERRRRLSRDGTHLCC